MTTFAKLINRTAIPPLFIILPASTKKGMASRVKIEIPWKSFWDAVVMAAALSRSCTMAIMEDAASATAIGIPETRITTRTMKIVNPATAVVLMPHLLFCYSRLLQQNR